MTLLSRRLPLWFGMMLILSGITATRAEAAQVQPSGQASSASFDAKPWGAFAELAGTVWQYDGRVVQFDWEFPGEVMLETTYADGRKYEHRYRLGLDGRTVTASGDSFEGYRTLSYPSGDSWAVATQTGSFNSGCRFTRDRNTLMCESVLGNGARKPFQMIKSDDAAIVDAVEAVETRRLAVAQAGNSEWAKWGVLSKAVGKDFIVTKTCERNANNTKAFYASTFYWDESNIGNIIIEENATIEDSFDLYPWKIVWKIDEIKKILTRHSKRFSEQAFPQAVAIDGTVEGRAVDIYRADWQELKLVNGNLLATRYLTNRKGDRTVDCVFQYAEREAGFFAASKSQSIARKQSIERAMQNEKSDGSGIGGALLGAIIGGALTGGSAEGIINGARAMSSDEGARQVYQEYEAQRIAQEQEAANNAEALARVAGYSSADSESTRPSGQSSYGSSASTSSRGSSAAAPTRPPVERRPLRLFMSVVPAVGEKDKTQPVCVSNVLDLGEVANWPDASGSYQDSVAYDAARPLFATFVSLCRNERGDMRTVSPATVQIINNGYAGTDLESERNEVINAHTPNAYWLVTM